MNEQVRHKLAEIIQRYGRDLCGQPKRCKGLLLDHCAGDRREVFVLVSALEEQVVGDLLGGLGGQPWDMVSSRLVRRLVEHRAMAEDAALWAVESWALALGLISKAKLVSRPPARKDHETKASPATAGLLGLLGGRSAREGHEMKASPVMSAPPDSGSPTRSVSGSAPAGAPEVITTRVGEIRLKLIPAGEFWMGSPDRDSEASDDEKPQHKIQISQAFYLGEAPLTQAQYEAVLGVNPSRFRGLSEDNPVEMVSWFDAVEFCNELSRRERLRPSYGIWGSRLGLIDGRSGYRLPTEAEWEYACRAGTEKRYCFGDGWARLGDYAWYSANSQGRTNPVRRKRANGFGLFDLHGNVWEWCWDGYDRFYYRHALGVDPSGIDEAACRVARGGSWNDKAPDVRSASRYRFSQGGRFNFLGFRIARGVPSR